MDLTPTVNGVPCDLLDQGGRLVVTPHAITLDGQTNTPADLREGESLADFLARHVPGIASGAWVVSIGGAVVPQAMWARTYPKHGQLIACRASVGRAVLALVAVAALSYFTLGTGATLGGSLLGINGLAAVGSMGLYAVNMGIFMAGSMLINKVLGPKVPSQRSDAAKQVYSLSGQRNSARPYESLPVLWGEMRVTPDLASRPYAWYEGDEQYLSTIVLGGVNVHSATDLAIGDTPISSFEGVEVYYNGFAGMASQPVPLYGNADAVAGGALEKEGAWVTRTSSLDALVLQIDIEGQLYDITGDGIGVNSVPLYIEHRAVGAGAWTASVTTTLEHSSAEALRRTFTISVAQGQYEVRARLGKPYWDEGEGKDMCNLTWAALKSVQPDATDYSQWGRIGVKIKATGQLNGSLDTLHATYRARPMPVWNGTAWATATTRETGLSNPGAILLQTLRGVKDSSGKLQFGFGLDDAQIDIEGLKAFMLHCTAKGFTYDKWLTGETTLGQFCQEVALAGMGEFSWTDGSRPTVVFVGEGQPVSAVVNMANMRKGSFSVAYALANAADGIEYQYLDRATWETKTLRVSAPGVTSPLNPARVTGEGVTSEAQAAILARYHLAQSLYQYKTIDFGADIEHLDYRRLSVLSLSHDMTQWGYGGRVLGATRLPGGAVTLQLDEPVPPLATRYIGVRVPGAREYHVFGVQSFAEATDTVTTVEAWPADLALPGEALDNPAHDTLWCYDFKATPGYRVRVVGMTPESDLSGAQVSCVPEGPEFWDYVINGTYTPAPSQSLLPALGRPTASNLRVTELVNVQGDTEWYELSVLWDVTGAYDHAQVWAGRDGAELRMVDGSATGSRSVFRIDGPGEWLISVRPFNSSGQVGTSASVLYVTTQTALPPRNVDTFVVQAITGGLRRYAWLYTGARPPAFAGVQIRYCPGDVALSVADWDTLTPLGEADDVYTAQIESTKPETGLWTFACRAIDTAGQLSPGLRRFVLQLDESFGDVQQPDLTPPPAPTGIVVTGGLSTVMVSWDTPTYTVGHGHARTEIWAGTSNAIGSATRRAESYAGPASFHGEAATTYYVWARHVSADGVAGAYAGPVSATTGADVAGALQALQSQTNRDAEKLAEAMLHDIVAGERDHAAIAVETSTRMSETGHLGALYAVRMALAQGGQKVVGGFALSGTSSETAGPTIDFGVLADKFWVAPPVGSSFANGFNLTIQTTPAVVNGVTIPPGLYVDAAYINNVTALWGRFGTLIADSIQATAISASQLTLGDGTVGGNLKSSNYAAGSTGWILRPDGSAEMSNVTVRGSIYSTTGNIGGVTINANGLNAGAFTGYGWPASGTGFHLGPNGLLIGNENTGKYFGVTAGGDVYMPGLTVVGGNATFSGALSAATGSFSGVLTASAINAVNTINIAGNAVTVPVGATAGALNITSAAWFSATGVGLTSGGGAVFIHTFASVPGYGYCRARVLRNGVSIADVDNSSCGVIDYPGAGSHWYSLELGRPSGHVGNLHIAGSTIMCLEVKR